MGALSGFRNLMIAARSTMAERPAYTVTQGRGAANIHIDPDVALTFSAYFACIRYISDQIALMPWNVYERRQGTRTMRNDHEVHYLLNEEPNGEMDALSFRRLLVSWRLGWGNGYAEIERAINGRPMALWPIHPSRVELKRDSGTSPLYYQITGEGGYSQIQPEDMFHIKGVSLDGLVGMSTAGLARHSLSLGIAAEIFGAEFFGNGAHVSGLLLHPGKLDDKARANLMTWWDKYTAKTKTKVGQTGRLSLAIVEEGMKFEKVSIPPNDAQFLETRQFQAEQICQWFGVPPHKIGILKDAHYNNIEHQNVQSVQDCLLPVASDLESESRRKLFTRQRASIFFTKINFNALMRGDTQARAEWYTRMRDLGVYDINEIRAYEDENEIGALGKKRLVPLNMTTLEKAGTEEAKPNAAGGGESDGRGQKVQRQEKEGQVKPAKPRAALADGAGFDRLIADFAARSANRLRQIYDRLDPLPDVAAAKIESASDGQWIYMEQALIPVLDAGSEVYAGQPLSEEGRAAAESAIVLMTRKMLDCMHGIHREKRSSAYASEQFYQIALESGRAIFDTVTTEEGEDQ